MNPDYDSIAVGITVPDIASAVEIYVNQWKLFTVLNWLGSDLDEGAGLVAINATVPLRLQLCLEERRDTRGELIPSGKTVRISFPRSDFWEWVDSTFGNRDLIEHTPWSASVILRDPFGHMIIVSTPWPEDQPEP